MSATVAKPPQPVKAEPQATRRTVEGTWLDTSQMIGSRITIYRAGNLLFAEQVFTRDGSRRKLELTERQSPLGRRLEEVKRKDDSGPTPEQRKMEATEAGHDFARTKLAELDKFKSSSEFRRYGFATGGPFHSWLTAVEAKRDDPTFTFSDQLAAGNLSSLGLEYLQSKGQETDLSRLTRREILETIEAGSIDNDAHDYWIIDAEGDLQIRDKDGLLATATKVKYSTLTRPRMLETAVPGLGTPRGL
jgi:hypothetical protein